MRRIVFAALCTALPFVALPSHAEAHVLVRVDRATQTMDVSVDGASVYRWPVSTGRRGFGPGRHLSPAAHGAALVLNGLLQRAHAACDLFSRRLSDPRELRDSPARRTGIAWLHP